ncbi:MAG TPA: substrate-binding domain-containing protein [Nitrososphaerales archaeon]|nr:substrate-binding domain-containing protein [Nitrososphaerales archaeon]
MRTQRSDIFRPAVGLAAIVAAVILVAAYLVSSAPPKTTTSTMTATSAMTSTVTSTATLKAAPLVSYSADAYAAEVTSLLDSFSTSTGVQVAPVTSGGSNADASAINAGAPDDVFVSASLSATSSHYLGNLTANWAIGFATDQLVLAYSNSTTQRAATTSIIALANTAVASNSTSDWNNFYTSLVGGKVKVGISAPAQDPAGLRAWIVLEAAGYLYSGGNQQTYASALLKDQGNTTAASAADLVAPLQAGDIQFLFTYKSAAISNRLNYIVLNSHVNLGTPRLGSFYSRFSYTDSAGVTAGAPIVICITIPLGVANSAEALQFVEYVVQNAKTLSTFGLAPLSPTLLYENTPPPVAIQQLVTQGLMTYNGALP